MGKEKSWAWIGVFFLIAVPALSPGEEAKDGIRELLLYPVSDTFVDSGNRLVRMRGVERAERELNYGTSTGLSVVRAIDVGHRSFMDLPAPCQPLILLNGIKGFFSLFQSISGPKGQLLSF